MDVGSHATTAVIAAATLVNLATPGHRQGRPYVVPHPETLARQISEGLDERPGPADPLQMRAYRALADAMRPVFELTGSEDADGAADAANELISRYAPQPRLVRHHGGPWHLHFHGARGQDPTGWGGGCAVGLATVLGSEQAQRLGRCGAPGCDRVFFDQSRNGTRRFCSTACQNRVKAAAHRERSR